MHYYQFNIGDYVSHTRHLSPIEDIAYRRLLDAYYLSERPLNSGVTSVARQIGLREYEQEVGMVLQEFFVLGEEGWTSSRADKEIAHYKSKIDQASRAGKASAERRSNARSTDVPTDVQPTNNHKPITNKTISSPSARFDDFWAAWPTSKRKVGRAACEAKWKTQALDPLADKIIASVARLKGSEQWTTGFEPSPLTYLNQKRWEDETQATTNVVDKVMFGRRYI
jgi:uncharacterized protein YdaU (DUF1376 family)